MGHWHLAGVERGTAAHPQGREGGGVPPTKQLWLRPEGGGGGGAPDPSGPVPHHPGEAGPAPGTVGGGAGGAAGAP
ncbi:hypothetical protein B5F12_06760 [Pseudoflavonifractor sp. An176]|nr:hypothetical protein B5F12_06760 [Pseudoflavonifractor sp. An176]